ncbi:hypothetical protein JKP88DRAFT_157226 [Tribonema minus]|uniref:Uncharacterized protein n=1 Tax=Tribonema minus TaxID=303371 RepID=A0A835YX96_9STRA|nr:hypothetical protein JKP88DRAFT_157226 [Tribonema minus]
MDLANVTASIRVDRATGLGSVIDVIRMVNPNQERTAATKAVAYLTADDETLRRSIQHVRINGKGKPTPCASARVLVEVVFLLPGKAARDFRRASATTVCRVLGGDLSIVGEVEARHHALQQTEGGRAAQEFLLRDDESSATGCGQVGQVRALPVELTLASQAERSAYFQAWSKRTNEEGDLILKRKRDEAALAAKKARAQFAVESYELLRTMGVADDRDRITFSDAVRRAVGDGGGDAEAVVEALAVGIDDPAVPTPECEPFYRGDEISMHTVASEMGVKIPHNSEGRIGKKMRALYRDRYGEAAAASIPKRSIEFRGQMFPANAYWKRDADLMRAAVQSVL